MSYGSLSERLTQQRAFARPVLVADLFCGAGGSSTGARRALLAHGYDMVLTCVNHWPVAIATHQANHPDARHYCQDVASVRPTVVVPEGRLDLLMASPTCTFHSRARGGRPTSDQQRMDPWHIITWLTELRVSCLIVENVPEFVLWGPVNVRTGRPIKSRRAEYFLGWVRAIEALGFRTDWRILNAADYGDATTRQRFFLIARSDGRPLRWPEATHAQEPQSDLFGSRERWRAAWEIIDWSHAGKSIFDRKKPLAVKTLARIHAGALKLGWPDRLIDLLRDHMAGRSPRPNSFSHTAGVVQPFILSQHAGGSPRSTDQPLPGMTCRGAHALITAYYGNNHSGKSVCQPLDTVTTKSRFGLVTVRDSDILYRMLEPREFAAAMGFSDAESRKFVGTKTEITAQIGNAVPVNTATALVGALMGTR